MIALTLKIKRSKMIPPIQREQDIFSHPSQPLTQKQHSGAHFQDVLTMSILPLQISFFKRAWDSITQFFQSIYNFLFGSKSTPTPTSDVKNTIQEIATRDQFVWFYKKEENPLTSFLGNFHPCTIRLWGLQFACAEAAFQAAKFSSDRTKMQQFKHLNGNDAFLLGRRLSQQWSPVEQSAWRNRNLTVMREVVKAKFEQNADLKALLLSTENAFLVEHIPVKGRDAYWGDDSDGTGQNWLGQIAMETRRDLGGGAPVRKNTQYEQFLTSLNR
jgi:ribA/ribD-fused uncharacterized protein